MPCRTYRKRRSNNSHLEASNENQLHRPSPTTLTKATMDAVAANEPGAKLSRSERQQIAKFVMWPLIGDTKAVAVRPRIGVREQQAIDRLMQRARVAA